MIIVVKKSISVLLSIVLMACFIPTFPIHVRASETGITINIDPNSVIEKDYMGIGVEIDPYEEAYSSSQWQMICNRLDYMQPSFVRCIITAGFFCTGYDANGNPVYNWNGWAMNLTYDILNYCQANNIPVVFGEWKKPNHAYLNISSSNDPRWIQMMADCMDYLLNVRGYTCIKYFTYINEPNGSWSINEGGSNWTIWKTGLIQLYNKFQEKGLNSAIKLVGPDTSGDDGWVDSTADQIPGYVGIYDVHRYATNADVLSGDLEKQMRAKRDYITNNDPNGASKKFFMGEAGMLDGTDTTGQTRIRSFEYGVYMADYILQSIRAGQAGVNAWMLDDAMHYYDYANLYKANWGFWDSGDVPADQAIRPWFYPVSLMSRYFPQNAQTIYAEESGVQKLRVASAKIPDGSNYHLSFAVVNNQNTPQTVTLKLPAAGATTTFKKYVYFESNRPADSNGYAVASETLNNVNLQQGITVTLPSQGFVLLTTMDAGNSIPLSTTVTNPKQPYNLVQNPGFENAGTAPWVLPQQHFSVSSEDAMGGQYSLKMNGTGDYCSVQQDISVTPYTDYSWTFYGKCSSAYNSFKVFTPSYGILADTPSKGNNQWTKYTLHFNSGNNSTLKIAIGDGSGLAYFDNFCVTKNLVGNAGFESADMSRWSLPSHFTVTTEEKYSGAKAVKLNGTADYCSIQQNISVIPNTEYTWTFYGKCSSAYNAIKVFSPTYAVIADGGSTLGNNVWTPYTVAFNSGNNRNVILAIGDGGGVNYFDDFAVTANLIDNGGFEKGALSAWYSSTSAGHFQVSSKEKRTGSYSLKMTGTGDYCSIQQDISVSPHTDYSWTFYGKCSSGYNNFIVLSAGYAMIANGGNTTGNNQWTKYTLNFNSGNNSTVKLAIGDGGGINYFDDFQLRVLNTVSTKNQGNYSRIASAMQRAMQGQPVTIGGIGGSITAGYGATASNKAYLSLVADWWAKKFPQSSVTCVNAGVSATDSLYGVSRVSTDLLASSPDFVIVEYAVNDSSDALHTEAYESLVRRTLSSAHSPGVVLLMMTGTNFITAQDSQTAIGKYYTVPVISFREALMYESTNNGLNVSSILPDGLHPNDTGHQMTADLIIQNLEEIYGQLFATSTQINTLPNPQSANRFATAKIFGTETPETSNTNWVESSNLFWQISNGWKATTANAKIVFTVESSVIHLMTLRKVPTAGVDPGTLSVVVDNGTPIVIDCEFSNGWGDYLNNVLLVNQSAKQQHTIEITFTGNGNEGIIFGLLGN